MAEGKVRDVIGVKADGWRGTARGGEEMDLKSSAATGFAVQLHEAAVAANYRKRTGKPQARAARLIFCRKERLERSIRNVRSHPAAVILDIDDNVTSRVGEVAY